MRRLILWGPPLALMALIFYSSSQSDPAPQVTQLVWDKALHASGYAVLAILFCRAMRGERFAVRTAAIVAILLTSLYGASDEWHQTFTPERTADLSDWMADSVGAVAGAAVWAGAALSTVLRQTRRPRR